MLQRFKYFCTYILKIILLQWTSIKDLTNDKTSVKMWVIPVGTLKIRIGTNTVINLGRILLY